MIYKFLLVVLTSSCAMETAPSPGTEKEKQDMIQSANVDQEISNIDVIGGVSPDGDNLADVPIPERLELVSPIQIDRSDFSPSGVSINTSLLNGHEVIAIEYDIPTEADFIQVLRCKNSTIIQGQTTDLDEVLSIENNEQRDDLFRNNLFWEDARSKCNFIADHFLRKTLLDSFAPSGEYYYLLRACVKSSRLEILEDGQTSRNCSRTIEKTSTIVYINERSQDVLETLETYSWQVDQENQIVGDIKTTTEKITRTLLKCQKREERRIVSVAKSRALANVISQTFAVFPSLGTYRGTINQLNFSKGRTSVKINGKNKTLNYTTRERGVDGGSGSETLTKYDGNVKFSQKNIRDMIETGDIQISPTGGKTQTLTREQTISNITKDGGDYTLTGIKHIRNNEGGTENLTIFGKNSKNQDVVFTAKRSSIDGETWSLDRDLPSQTNDQGVGWGRTKDSLKFKYDKDSGTDNFYPVDSSFTKKKKSFLDSLVSDTNVRDHRTRIRNLAAVQVVRDATIMPLVTTETFAGILTKASHIKTNCVEVEEYENQLNVLHVKLKQSHSLKQKLGALVDLKISKWEQTRFQN